MSNTEDNKKKGFFSRLFGGFGASKEPEQAVSSDEDIIETQSEVRKYWIDNGYGKMEPSI